MAPRTMLLLVAAVAVAHGLQLAHGVPATRAATAARAGQLTLLWGRGNSAVEDDFQRRQAKLAERQAQAASQPKGTVEVTFPQKGDKMVLAKQGEPIGNVIKRAGMRVKFDCKNGRCATCQVRLNGRAAAKICQGATIPGGATRKLKVTLDNP
mmetsp:Transcript_45342/g.98674  ORF Transcript_45342/g.98674 Transcript_45342/m.98674 type:complete len:153 (-) Transcript_45342:417-875(-)